MKKTIIVILTLILLLGIGWFFYLYYGNKEPVKQTFKRTITKISDDEVISPAPSKDSNSIWYFNSKGQLFNRKLDGSDLTEYAFPNPIKNFSKALWPSMGQDIIIQSVSNISRSYTFYDEVNKKFIDLPQNIQSLEWMPDGKRILYIWKSDDGKAQQLVLANADTTGFRILTQLPSPDMTIKVSPDGKQALLIPNKLEEELNKIYKTEIENGFLEEIVTEGKNTEAMWLDSNKFLFLQKMDNNNILKLYDLSTKKIIDLSISAPLTKLTADKTGKFIYVISGGSTDQLIKLDLSNQKQEIIYSFDASIRPRNLFMNNQTILFINAVDKKLYSLIP